jgi:hypothetical protein
MPDFAWALLLKPFIALVIIVPVRFFVMWLHRRMKDGKLKRLLFLRISRP